MKLSTAKMQTVWEELQRYSLMEGEFSCLMAPAPPIICDKVLQWGQMFITPDTLYKDPEDPGGFGMETEVHVTVKFGLHEGRPTEKLLRIIEETQPFEIEVGPCTLFENEKFDVVKFDVDSEGLRQLNERISELPNSDSHPEYHPHMTVAYVTKGTCNELIGKPLMDPVNDSDFRFIVERVIFSSKDKLKTTLFLGRPNLRPQQTREAEEPVDHPFQQGRFLGMPYNDIRQLVLEHIDELRERGYLDGLDFEVMDVIPTGSRVHGKTPPREDSDFDVVVLYKGVYEGTSKRLREDDLFNALNAEESDGGDPLYVDGIKVDMNPIYIDRYHAEPHIKKLIIGENSSDLVAEILGEADRQRDAVTNKGPERVAKPALSHYTANKAPGTNRAVAWTKPDADAWLESVRPALEAIGYSARIVGSVDRHGGSDKDLDVLLTPTSGQHNVAAAVTVLAEHSQAWGRADEDLFNAILPDGHIVEFWFEGLQDLMDEIDWDTQEFKPEGTAYNDEATQLPKGSLYYGKLAHPGANPLQ